MGDARLRPTVAAWLAALAALALGATAARAADDASPWDGDIRSAARLIAGAPADASAAVLRAGVEIRLKPGWHTYWRYPGDAGVPPQFDFAGSQNLKSVEVLWPAPRQLPEDGLTAIGYDRDLILPLRVIPQQADKPVVLALKLDYAICEKLCVPAVAKAELRLGGAPMLQASRFAGAGAVQDMALAAAEARVPIKRALGDGEALVIRSVRREDGGSRPRIVIDVAAPAATPVMLFAEGPDAQWSLPVPAARDGAPAGLQRFSFELDGAPPGASYDGALVTLTAVTERAAIEVPIHLDASLGR
jgi:cytochrome c biogenesis DsbD-like protein